MNNASYLGPSPAAAARRLPARRARARATRSTSFAPLALVQDGAAADSAHAAARIVNVTSDAAVEAYEGWGGYGSSKAALEQLTATCSAPRSRDLRVYTVDPGDLRTQMHQEAFPGEDISDRPLPEGRGARARPAAAKATPPSGRYRGARTGRGGMTAVAESTPSTGRLQFELPPSSRRRCRPRPAASPATPCG